MFKRLFLDPSRKNAESIYKCKVLTAELLTFLKAEGGNAPLLSNDDVIFRCKFNFVFFDQLKCFEVSHPRCEYSDSTLPPAVKNNIIEKKKEMLTFFPLGMISSSNFRRNMEGSQGGSINQYYAMGLRLKIVIKLVLFSNSRKGSKCDRDCDWCRLWKL